AGFESGVGLYLDDVYLNRPQASVLDIYDVERIEVLRGPQGTLYGRNTIGGAVKYVTRGLSDEPTASVRVNVGSYNQLDVIASASTPLTDTVRVGGAVARLSREGYGDNLYNGIDNYNKSVWAGRVSAEFDLTENFQVRVAADYTDDASNARQGHRLIPDQFPAFTYPVLDDEFDTRAGLDFPEQSVEAYGGSVTAEWMVNDSITLKSITAYREDESTSPIDFDSLPEADLDVPAIYANDQFSQELQMLFSGERVNGVIGAY
ncbi:MAG TPA: TonB-dependent receptor, partial [Oceanicaulis sp.]|nr:TonB-dependent receptor [Oceanicaulis sp.]